VWSREVAGLRLTFHLAGINNQNFLMRDDQTGSYWQQISGRAVAGPLAGRGLTLVPSDELTFATWKAEAPSGTVLKDAPGYVSEYAPRDWDVKMARGKGVLNFPEHGLRSRDLMLGIQAFGASRAYLYSQVLKEKLVQDRVGGEPVLLVVSPDQQSVRAFHSSGDFYTAGRDAVFLDAATGSKWNFQGCAISGPRQGACLERVAMLKDFWFDWRNYNPGTTVYRR